MATAKTILIVDDEPDIADVVTASLEEQGYRVVVACNGLEGLKQLSEASPDLLICDWMMPFMDGATMCQRLCSDPRHDRLRIIVASVMDEAAIETQFPRYDGFLHKPYRLGTLLDMVDTLVTR